MKPQLTLRDLNPYEPQRPEPALAEPPDPAFVLAQLFLCGVICGLLVLLVIPTRAVLNPLESLILAVPLKLPVFLLLGGAVGTLFGGFQGERILGGVIGFVVVLVPATVVFLCWFWWLAHTT